MTPRDVEELASHWTAAQHTVASLIRAMVTDFHQSEEVLQRVAVTLVRKYDQYDRQPAVYRLGVGRGEARGLDVPPRGKERSGLVFDDALLDRIAEGHERAAATASHFPIRHRNASTSWTAVPARRSNCATTAT